MKKCPSAAQGQRGFPIPNRVGGGNNRRRGETHETTLKMTLIVFEKAIRNGQVIWWHKEEI